MNNFTLGLSIKIIFCSISFQSRAWLSNHAVCKIGFGKKSLSLRFLNHFEHLARLASQLANQRRNFSNPMKKVGGKSPTKKLLGWKCRHYLLFHLLELCVKLLFPLTFFTGTFLPLFNWYKISINFCVSDHPNQNYVTHIVFWFIYW